MNKIGRNEPCPCGSGIKYKNCCGGNGKPDSVKKKVLTQNGMNRCFLKLVKDTGGLEISCADLDGLPKDEALGVRHDPETDSFRFDVVKIKQSPIIQPDKRIRIARN